MVSKFISKPVRFTAAPKRLFFIIISFTTNQTILIKNFEVLTEELSATREKLTLAEGFVFLHIPESKQIRFDTNPIKSSEHIQ